ncbi:MAG: hypothetical protein OEY49_16260 [Candidatus Heimdallarchaeota archaeon]|nr:hypothetical protein [Candidatus Heimdallarchaeota archaeon]
MENSDQIDIITACNTSSCCSIRSIDQQPSIVYKGKIIYFCENECVEEFNEDPEGFLHSDHFKLNFEDLKDNIEKDT